MSNTFDKEWLTVGDHRILVHQRVGPPETQVRRAAMIAAWAAEEIDPGARVVEAWFDNKHTSHLRVTVGVLEDDPFLTEGLESSISHALDSVFNWGVDHAVEVLVVPTGNVHSDGYDRTEHIVRSVLRARGQEGLLA